jgi:hypothetical protein
MIGKASAVIIVVLVALAISLLPLLIASNAWGKDSGAGKQNIDRSFPGGVMMTLPKTVFGYNGSSGYTFFLVNSSDLTLYQQYTLKNGANLSLVNIVVLFNLTDLGSTLQLNIFANGKPVPSGLVVNGRMQSYNMFQLSDQSHFINSSRLCAVGEFSVVVDRFFPAGTVLTIAIHADGPVYLAVNPSVTASSFWAKGGIGDTVPSGGYQANVQVMVWGEED